MARITSNIVNDARKTLKAWRAASKQTGATFDEEFQTRECAGLLGVDFQLLWKRLRKK